MKQNQILYKCPGCGRLVPAIKRPSVAGILFVPGYLIYYYLLKKPECVYCGYKFTKQDLKLNRYADSEATRMDERVRG